MGEPWAGLLRAALALGLPPESFWRLSVAEWRALTHARLAPLGREELSALARRYPDGDRHE